MDVLDVTSVLEKLNMSFDIDLSELSIKEMNLLTGVLLALDVVFSRAHHDLSKRMSREILSRDLTADERHDFINQIKIINNLTDEEAEEWARFGGRLN